MKKLVASLLLVFCLIPFGSSAHPSPNSIILLDVSPGQVNMEIQIPLPELALVLGDNIQQQPEMLSVYLREHLHAYVNKEHPWLVDIKKIRMDKALYETSNVPYQELIAEITLIPNDSESTRNFFIQYDAVMHQVMNHVALAFVRTDWEGGVLHNDTTEQAHVIGWDLANNSIPPMEVNLESGSSMKGFTAMIGMGMHHIKDGTDHLLFLITLLLPIANIRKLIGIVTAFTIGHSLTLLIGAFNLVSLPQQPVEILIAFSILISAVHVIKPIFIGKEAFVAAGFGLIHGLAFATILSDLHVNNTTLIWSVFGFNIGIELMQLFVVAMIVPWLMLLSQTTSYRTFKIAGAIVAGIAALAWITERSMGTSNFITDFVATVPTFAIWAIAILALFSLIAYWRSTRTTLGVS